MSIAMRVPAGCGLIGLAVCFALPNSGAFTTTGGSLSLSDTNYQRDFRFWNNAGDASANSNTTPDSNYPGALGATQAVWKAARAWGSHPGGAGKNFEFDFQGEVSSSGGMDGNTVSFQASGSPCGSGVVTYMVGPISNGWQIRVCDDYVYSDDPNGPQPGQVDLQGIMTTTFGLALGLGATQSSNCDGNCATEPTMCTVSSCLVTKRTLEADDLAGLAFLYGEIPPDKPIITGLSGSTTPGGTLTIHGSAFPTDVLVKFTAGTTQNSGAIPGVVPATSTSGGTAVSVLVPPEAMDGNVLVWAPAIDRLSNAFPFDIGATATAPQITSVQPATVQTLGGTPITLTGVGFSGVTQIDFGGVLLGPADFQVVDSSTITFEAPDAVVLGAASVTATNSAGTSAPTAITFVLTDPLTLIGPAALINGTVAQYRWGGKPNQNTFLSVNATGVTGTSQGLSLLIPLFLVPLPPTSGLGLGKIAAPINSTVPGATVFTQIWTLSGQDSSTLEVSNIHAASFP